MAVYIENELGRKAETSAIGLGSAYGPTISDLALSRGLGLPVLALYMPALVNMKKSR